MPKSTTKVSSGRLRHIMLEVIGEFARGRSIMSSDNLLNAVRERLRDQEWDSDVLLVVYGDMFRQGMIGWGANLANINPPWLHITDRAKATFATLSRDPANPDGYMGHLASAVKLNVIATSYIREALETYNAVCYKATAVMVGAAAESVVLELRDAVVARLTALSRPVPDKLKTWVVLTAMKAIQAELDRHKPAIPKELRESYESRWLALTHEIRVCRNDAGHPTDVAPVTAEDVHAALLMFPSLALLGAELRDWVSASMP